MKKIITLLFLAAIFNVCKSQKIAHLSFDSLVSLMPETKTATEAANKYLKGLESELVTMQTEFESKYNNYMQTESTMSDMVKQNKQNDLQQLQNRIQDFKSKAEVDFRQKQVELTTPIMNKAKKGIEVVAKENGYRYVIDTSVERTSVLYAEPSDDILMLVKKKLDAMPLANIPGATPPEGIKMPPPAGNNTAPKKK